jgi:hypothetical protein
MNPGPTIRTVFYVEGFPDLKEGTPVTITVPANAGRRFAVEIDLPVDWINRPTSPRMAQAFSPASSLSPGEDLYRSRDLTSNSSRTSIGLDSSIDAERLTPSRSPLLYPQSMVSPTLSLTPTLTSPRQPTLLEAMQQNSPSQYRSPPPQSPTFRPQKSLPPTPLSPSYNSADGFSPVYSSPQVLSGYKPDYRGNTVEYANSPSNSPYRSSPCTSQYVGGQSYRPTAEELDVIRRNSPEPY